MMQSFIPTWGPEALRQPALGYGVALLIQLLAIGATSIIVLLMPHFMFAGLISVLGIVATALLFGPGPSLLATFLGALLLAVVVLPQWYQVRLNSPTDVASLFLYAVVGITISVIAGQVERGRRVAERLAAQVATQAGQTLTLQRERMTHERAAARARVEALETSRRQMDEFLGLASHELRTPLTVAMANVQIVRRQTRTIMQLLNEVDAEAVCDSSAGAGSADDEKALVRRKLVGVTTLLDRTDAAMTRLNRLVNDLLDATRIEEGRFTVTEETCELGALLTRAAAEQRLMWPHRMIEVSLPTDTVAVRGDAKRLTQVAEIFLANALKFAPPNRPVRLRLTQVLRPPTVTSQVWSVSPTATGSTGISDEPSFSGNIGAGRTMARLYAGGAWARIEVSDEGPGLTPAQQAQVWERFERIEGIERQEGSVVGVGLGLYIARAIVERHGGRVGVVSAPGGGATFWCEAPMLALAGGEPRDAPMIGHWNEPTSEGHDVTALGMR